MVYEVFLIFNKFINLRFGTSSKNLPLRMKTPGGGLIRGDVYYLIGRKD